MIASSLIYWVVLLTTFISQPTTQPVAYFLRGAQTFGLWRAHSITIKLTLLVDGFTTWCTTVYGPQTDAQKIQFLDELKSTRLLQLGAWMIYGDFNMVYNAGDKNNDRLHRRMMGRFQRFLNDLELKELHLHGRIYTCTQRSSGSIVYSSP